MDLSCGDSCQPLSWTHVSTQIYISLVLWALLLGFGLLLAFNAATSNMDQWKQKAAIFKGTLRNTKWYAWALTLLSVFQCCYFIYQTYSEGNGLFGLFLVLVNCALAFVYFITCWADEHLTGFSSGASFMFGTAPQNAILIFGTFGVLASKDSWFMPGFTAVIYVTEGIQWLERIYGVNLETAKWNVFNATVSCVLMIYLFSMVMLTLENLGDPPVLAFLDNNEWNVISSTYFIFVSLATVGYGDLVPKTGLGRFFTIVMVVYGLFNLAMMGGKLAETLTARARGAGRVRLPNEAKYIVVAGNPSPSTVKTFLDELFHEDHAGDSEGLYLTFIFVPGSKALDFTLDYLKDRKNVRIAPRIHVLQGSVLNLMDLQRASAGDANTFFVLPDEVCLAPLQEDTDNVIRATALARVAPTAQLIVVLLRAESKSLLTELGNVSALAMDQFKLEIVGKTCSVPGFSSLVCNLCKSIGNDDEDEDEPKWKQDYLRGTGYELYEVELNGLYAKRGSNFLEVVTDIMEQTGGNVYLLGFVEQWRGQRTVLVNPGPMYQVKSSETGVKTMGIFMASDREAIVQCEEGMVFLGRKERPEKTTGQDETENDKRKTRAKAVADIAERYIATVPRNFQDKARQLTILARQHQRAVTPARPPLKKLAEGGHVLVLCVGTQTKSELRLSMEHLVRPLRLHTSDIDSVIPIVVLSPVLPSDWYNLDSYKDVYFIQGNPTSAFHLQRANFAGAGVIFIYHAGSGRVGEVSNEPWAVDSEVVICTRIVESMMPQGVHVPVIVDLSSDGNHIYVPLPGVDHVEAQGADLSSGRRKLMKIPLANLCRCRKRREASKEEPEGAESPAAVKERVKDVEYFLAPRFAAGQLFASSVVLSLAANSFYSPSLIDLITAMVTAQIKSAPLPEQWVGKPYAEFFDYLLFSESLLGIGICRTVQLDKDGHATEDGGPVSVEQPGGRLIHVQEKQHVGTRFSYIYTAPQGKDTVMRAGDMVVCFMMYQDGKA